MNNGCILVDKGMCAERFFDGNWRFILKLSYKISRDGFLKVKAEEDLHYSSPFPIAIAIPVSRFSG